MALAQLNLSSYLNIAKAIKEVQHSCWTAYDAEADVLYINFHSPAKVATDSEVTDDDIVIRYAEDEIIGLTILAVKTR